MTNKHTPGPWEFDPKAIRGMYWVKGLDGHPLAYVEHLESVQPRVYHDANAKLIAAAPELLDALQTMLASFVSHFPNGEEVRKARSAIAKAMPLNLTTP